MAGDWIKIEHALPNKPEVMEMAEILDISEWEVVGHLVCFWTWVDQNFYGQTSGSEPDKRPVVRGTFRGLDRVAGHAGFAQAMVDVGWLGLTDGIVNIPNYDDHLSQSAKARALESKRKRRGRAQSGQTSGSEPDTSGTKHGTREEKRREDKKKTGKAGVLSLVSDEILADPVRVLKWFEQASTGRGKILEPTHLNKINVVALARRIIKDTTIENPAACFVDCIKKKIFKFTNAEEKVAEAAIKLIERGPPGERTSDLSVKSKSKEQQLREAKEKFGTGEK